MALTIGVDKDVTFTTRDFCATSRHHDGTQFQVQLRTPRRGGTNQEVRDWFEAHLHDNHRIVFKAEDPDFERDYLECHDETEALALILALQRELNEALV